MSIEPLAISLPQNSGERELPIPEDLLQAIPTAHRATVQVFSQLAREWMQRHPAERAQVAVVTKNQLHPALHAQIGRYVDLACFCLGKEPNPLSEIENSKSWLDFIVCLDFPFDCESYDTLIGTCYFNLNAGGAVLLSLAEQFHYLPKSHHELLPGRNARMLLDLLVPAGFVSTAFGSPHVLHAARSACYSLEMEQQEVDLQQLPEPVLDHSLVLQAVKKQQRVTPTFAGPSVRPKALLYNNYFHTAGGGERSTLDLAMAIDDLGFEVQLATAQRTDVCMESLKASFGIGTSRDWPLQQFLSEGELAIGVEKQQFDLFVNHTFCSYMPNPAPLGWYMVMFPYAVGISDIHRLESYQTIACISPFVEQYVHQRWSKELPTAVVVPPISAEHLATEPISLPDKEPLILNIGRFNVKGHNKCQLEAIEHFVRLRQEGVISSEWRMIVAGYVNLAADNEAYLAQCRQAAEGMPIEIITNVSFETIRSLYRRASCLWQFTGIGLPFGEKPERCEHLGLVALDCHCYGVIPVAYQRGGAAQLIDHGVNGYCFEDYDDLRGIMGLLSDNYLGPFHRRMLYNSLAKAEQHSFQSFRNTVENQLRREMLQ